MLQNKFLYFFLGVTLVFAPAQAVKILVLSDVAITNYYGAMAQAGCEKAVQEFGNSVTDSCDFVTDVAGTEAALRSHLSDDSYDHWVLASSSYGKRFAKVAADFPHRTVSVATRAVTEAPNAQGAIFSEDQAGFLAGALAGLTTQSGTVGVLGGQPNDAVRKYVNGYVMGVLHTCPSCRVVRRYALSFTDPAEGQQLAEELIAEGADVVFGAGGATGSAGIAKAAADQVFVIGVDVDESNNPPFDDNLNVEYEYILSSALKRVDQSVYWSLKDRLTGKWVGLNRVMDATNKGIGMAKAKSPTALGAMAQVKSLALAGAGDVCPKSISRTNEDHLAVITQQLETGALSTKVDPAGFFTTTSEDTLQHAVAGWLPVEGIFGLSPPDLESHSWIHISGTNTAILFGGKSAAGVVNGRTYLFDFDRRSWTVITDYALAPPTTVPAPRSRHAAGFVAPNMLVVHGGLDTNGNTLDDLWTLDTTTLVWTKQSTSGVALSAHAGTVMGGNFYLYGGTTEDSTVSSKLFKFDFASGSMSEITPKSPQAIWPEAKQKAALIASGPSRMILFGGSTATGMTNSLYLFSAATNTWELLDPSGGPPPRVESLAVVRLDDNRILFLGGKTSESASARTFIYNLPQNKWVFTESQDLPVGTNSLAAIRFVQSDVSTACGSAGSDLSGMKLCTPITKPVIVAYGGSQQSYGVTSEMYIAMPLDEAPPRPIMSLNKAIVAVLNVFAAFGTALTVAAMGGVWIFRKHRVVASASPAFVLLTAFGILLGQLSIFVYANTGSTRAGFMSTVWLMSTGFTVAFGAMWVKTHRLYRIFNAKVRISVSQSGMFASVGGFCAVIWTYMIIWMTVFPISDALVPVGDVDWVRCTGRYLSEFGYGLIGLVLILLIALSYLSFCTRNVWQRYNETTYIGYSAYSVTLSAIIILPILLFLKEPTVVDALSCLIVEVCLYTILIAVIGSKFWLIRRYEEPETDMEESSAGGEDSTVKCKACMQPLLKTASATQNKANSQPKGSNTQPTAVGSPPKPSYVNSSVLRSGSMDRSRGPT